tara:strand:+ start:25 stop:1734 length:1710 start_codon:yes stop_codon:yes gene_type:complete
MATVDQLIVEIKADTKDLRKKLDQTNKQLKNTGKNSKQAGTSMAAAFSKARVAVVALGAAAALLGRNVVKVGMEFETLAVSLNKVFGGMEQGKIAMQRVITFAQTTPFQIETVTKAFIALKSAGIEPNEAQLQTFADTASVATDTLGTFEALIKMTQRSVGGGLGLEELNMITDRGVDVFTIFQDRLGLTRQDIADFGKSAEGAAILVKALTSGLQERFGGAVADQMETLAIKASNLEIAWKSLMDEIYRSGLDTFLKKTTDELTGFLNRITQSIKDYKELGGVNIYTWFGGQDGGGTGNMETPEPTDEEIERIRLMGRELNLRTQLLGIYRKSQDPLKEIKQIMKEGDAAIEPFFKKMKDMGQIDKDLDFTEFKNSINEVIDKADDVEGAAQMMTQAIVSTSQAFAMDFVDALMNSQNALDAFKDFARKLVSQIIAIFLQMAVINKILNAIFHTSGLGLGGEDFKELPTLAGGGAAQRGQPTIVGERGPEIFVPNTGGTIMNNMNTRNAMGGGSPVIVNQSINFATGVVPTVRAEVTKMLPQISDVTKGAVLEAAMRGGSYRRGLQGG